MRDIVITSTSSSTDQGTRSLCRNCERCTIELGDFGLCLDMFSLVDAFVKTRRVAASSDGSFDLSKDEVQRDDCCVFNTIHTSVPLF